MVVKAGNDANDYTADFRKRDNTNIMRIRGDGNVGIGTTSPSAKLDISGAAPVLELTDTGSTASYGWQPTSNDLRLFDFNTSLERLRIDSSGNVGIGTSSPSFLIEAYGATNASTGWNAGGTVTGFAQANTSNGDFRFGTTTSHAVGFYINGTERMRIDSSGKLLVGKTSSSITTAGTEITSSSLLQSVSDTSTNLATNGGAALNLCNTSATNGNFSNIGGYNSNGLVVSQMNFINLNHASRTGAITLSTHDGTSLNEAMRIDSSGRVGIGTTSPNAKLTVDGQGAFGSADASGNGIYLYVSGALSDNSYMSRSSSGTGTTTWYIGNQSITTSSDVRLKDNIVDSERNAVEIINNLRVVDHTWNDPSDQSVNNKNSRGVWTGLIAQEAVEHIPWLVNRPLEDVDENGYENYWHMDYGYAVPLLIKAIQEQQAMIEILQAEVAALKGA
jgi:hypothetical protein